MTHPSSPLNAVVVGVGRMGQHHARNYGKIPGFHLVAIVDLNEATRTKIAGEYGCKGFSSVDELLAWSRQSNTPIHAASVAVPTVFHRAVAEQLMQAGADVLIEKPLAPNVADAQAIVDAARNLKRILQVGHTERFNPVYRALQKYELHPKFVEVHRISPMTFRSIDVGVVLDMMIHDIDLVNHLVKSPVVDVRAVGVTVIGGFEDIANARLTFANGCVANLTASRLALRTERKMRLFSPNAYVTVDYQKKSGAVITRTANEKELERVRKEVREGRITDLMQLNYPELVKYEDLAIQDTEPVRVELESFEQAIRNRSEPEVTGEDGLVAVDISCRIAASVAAHKWDGVTPP
ncbi:MAG TPA: Gfo/Idh/MocA family oxidoreductase [Phycisphaerae bacterium]|nr:Gfo/Idh/MocA family oxidoreductase [Phycisphaerae bacterium]